MLRLTSIYLTLMIVMLAMSGCIQPTIDVDITKKLVGSVSNGNVVEEEEDDIDSSIIAALTGPLTASDSGFCFYHSPVQNYCWGRSSISQATNTANINLAPSHLSGKTIKSFYGSSDIACVIASDDKPYCWGFSALGNGGGVTIPSKVPVPVDTTGVLSGKIIKNIFLANSVSNVCALDSLNELYCWGINTNGTLGNGTSAATNIPTALDKTGVLNGKTIKTVGIGTSHMCAIASDDKVYCWGGGSFGRLGNGSLSASSSPVAAVIPGGLTVKSLSTSQNTNCVIASNDQVYCWGYGSAGNIGNGSSTNQTSPTAVSAALLAGKTVTSLSIKNDTACVVADGEAYCWGSNTNGRIGRGNTTLSNLPVAVDTSGVLNSVTLKSIEVGERSTCALSTLDKLYCWGWNGEGLLGNGGFISTYLPSEVVTTGALSGKTIKKVSMSGSNVCVIASDDEVYCWGGNTVGQLGNGSEQNVNEPVALLKKYDLVGKKIKSFGGSDYNRCVLADDNWVYCSGLNTYISGNVHDLATVYPLPIYRHSFANAPVPNPIFHTNLYDDRILVQSNDGKVYGGQLGRLGFLYSTGSARIKKVFKASYYNYCYMDSLDDLYCSGYYPGDGQHLVDLIPQRVDKTGVLNGLGIKNLAMGLLHTCALASDKNVYCWGNNTYGQLGIGTADAESRVPIAINKSGVLSGKLIKAVYASYLSTCVIADDDKAYCWGLTTGDGTGAMSLSPVAVDTTGALLNKKIRNITMSLSTICAIADDLAGYCWGATTGDGTGSSSASPVAIKATGALLNKTIKGFAIADASPGHACVLASDDQVYCWGSATYGQLGNGSNSDVAEPTALDTSGVLLNKTIKHIAIKQTSTCVVASDDKVYCFGNNNSYQLGQGDVTNSSVPVELQFAP